MKGGRSAKDWSTGRRSLLSCMFKVVCYGLQVRTDEVNSIPSLPTQHCGVKPLCFHLLSLAESDPVNTRHPSFPTPTLHLMSHTIFIYNFPYISPNMCVRAIPDKPENPETSKTKLIKKGTLQRSMTKLSHFNDTRKEHWKKLNYVIML